MTALKPRCPVNHVPRWGVQMVLIASLAIAAGCDDNDLDDAGMDAAFDSGPDAARVDAPPPMCAPSCGPAEVCCELAAGTECFDLRNDPRHCGECSVDCINENRGDGCAANNCTCGGEFLGCSGMRDDFCCPARRPGTPPYCANLETSGADCGGCNVRCDPERSDRCSGGSCRCGEGRDQCAGTPESMCCQAGVDVMCADTTSDRFHCGSCDNLCRTGERCEDSSCTLGASCPAECAPGEICCDGSCCSRRACMAGTCGADPVDAGTPDAGTPDAGTADAGTADAGTADAG